MNIPEKLIERLAKARNIAVLTGAGISAESGIKTYRDPDGLWAKLSPDELASMDGFMANPDAVWNWYQQRKEIIATTKPNPGHYALAEMENMFPVFTVVTQNIDQLHQAAGSKNVYELHGNIIQNHCNDCKAEYKGEINLDNKSVPKCPICGGMIRPSVVWFGEMLPEEALSAAQRAVNSCDIFFGVGTSAEVYPAAYLPIMAKQSGAVTVEVNPNNTTQTNSYDYHLKEKSGVALPLLVEALKKYKKEHSL